MARMPRSSDGGVDKGLGRPGHEQLDDDRRQGEEDGPTDKQGAAAPIAQNKGQHLAVAQHPSARALVVLVLLHGKGA